MRIFNQFDELDEISKFEANDRNSFSTRFVRISLHLDIFYYKTKRLINCTYIALYRINASYQESKH